MLWLTLALAGDPAAYVQFGLNGGTGPFPGHNARVEPAENITSDGTFGPYGGVAIAAGAVNPPFWFDFGVHRRATGRVEIVETFPNTGDNRITHDRYRIRAGTLYFSGGLGTKRVGVGVGAHVAKLRFIHRGLDSYNPDPDSWSWDLDVADSPFLLSLAIEGRIHIPMPADEVSVSLQPYASIPTHAVIPAPDSFDTDGNPIGLDYATPMFGLAVMLTLSEG